MKIAWAFMYVMVIVVKAAQSKQTRIAGGQDAVKGQFPWLVSIQATNFEEGWHLCGGILITPEWVLTAAHCLDSEKPEWLWVISGEHDTSVEEGSEQYLLVDSFVKHPEYTYWEVPYHNDIGLIHLSTPATIDEYTSLANIPHDSSQVIEGPCVEAGWGSTWEGVAGSDILQWAQIPLLLPALCEAAYPTFTHDDKIICAGNVNGGVGYCVGDNGGGLVCWDTDNSWYTVNGIMSWREGCAAPDLPAVYMDIPRYRDWIIDTITAHH